MLRGALRTALRVGRDWRLQRAGDRRHASAHALWFCLNRARHLRCVRTLRSQGAARDFARERQHVAHP